jgi:hypothetical protein
MTAKEIGKFIFSDLAYKKTPGGDAPDTDSDNKINVEGDIWTIDTPSKYKTFEEFNKGFNEAMRLIGLGRKDKEYNIKLSKTYKHYYKNGLPTANV